MIVKKLINSFVIEDWKKQMMLNFDNLKSSSNTCILSWKAYQQMIDGLINMILNVVLPKDEYKQYCRLFGVARGSLPLMTHISNKLKLKYGIIQYQTRDNDDKEPKIIYPDLNEFTEDIVIIVEDIIDTGKTVKKIIDMPIFETKSIFIFSLFSYENIYFKEGVYAYTNVMLRRKDNVWIVFPWER